MENIIIGGLLSFVVTFYAIPVIIQVAKMKKLYDLPGERKIHAEPIPSLGGLGMFAGFLMAFLLLADITTALQGFQYYLASFLVVFFFGIKDDVLVITPMKKFLGQVAVASILMFKANLLITNMHGFLSINIINPAISYLLTMFTIIVVMNAYNLIDGVDGLAGSIGIITSSVFAVFFFMNGDMFYAMMGFCFAASLAAFLVYNFSPAKIFMGDTGAMLTGLISAILVIRFIQTAEESKILPVLASPAMGFGILLLPLLDTLRVFSIRILHGRSPFSPDRNHLHHILLDCGLSHKKITLTLSVISLFFIVISYYALPLGTTKVILTQFFLFFSGILALQMARQKKRGIDIVKEDGDSDEPSSRKRMTNVIRLVGNSPAVIEGE